MVTLGNFLFRERNRLFPLLYVFLFVPSHRIFANPLVPLVAGLSIAIFGQTIRVTTIGLKYIVRGGNQRRVYAEELVTDGMFSHVRNPLYLGNALVLVGLGIMSNTLLFNLVVTPFLLLFYQAIVKAEEQYLLARFGPDFVRYCEDVGRWCPRCRGLADTLGSMDFKWRRVIVKEYGSFYIWTTGATLIVLRTMHAYQNGKYYGAVGGPLAAVLAVLLLLYLTARYLKKSGILAGD